MSFGKEPALFFPLCCRGRDMQTPGKAGAALPAAPFAASPFATGIVVPPTGTNQTVAAPHATTPRATCVRWNQPQSRGLDELDMNLAEVPSVTPGKGILKTPSKNPGARLRSISHNCSGGGLGSPVRTPGKAGPLALSKTPGTDPVIPHETLHAFACAGKCWLCPGTLFGPRCHHTCALPALCVSVPTNICDHHAQ